MLLCSTLLVTASVKSLGQRWRRTPSRFTPTDTDRDGPQARWTYEAYASAERRRLGAFPLRHSRPATTAGHWNGLMANL
ncbi:hypothetical protein K466DRAFT_318788 [Polyporus arcularius HHB13444]|uniref:Secreted protein n=1 Tax=Polyporus arcularius HHB13444 TaxID=1314778 RepID=A0A5C3NXX8_9APHY|nr:hypothetical protein K466DRAFT_318788 [Polyporus arcularius HHB13444]